MKVFLVSLVLALAVAASYAEVNSAEDLNAYNYHMKVGIPKALMIKRNEQDAADAGLAGQRIVGGSVTDISEVPYQVGLINRIVLFFISVCGGSLISHNRVVTAAHCHYDGVISAESHTVVLGSNTIFSGGHRENTTNIVVHDQWNPNTIVNDIAVLHIGSVTFSNVIQPIALPSGDELNSDWSGQTGLASGYGLTSDDAAGIPLSQRLSSVNLQIITNNQCSSVYGSIVQNSNICTSGAGGQGTCQGDSGGPLALQSNGRKILVGATSFGSGDGCSIGLPAAYTKISSYASWVSSI